MWNAEMRSEARSQVRFVFGRKIKIVKFVKQGGWISMCNNSSLLFVKKIRSMGTVIQNRQHNVILPNWKFEPQAFRIAGTFISQRRWWSAPVVSSLWKSCICAYFIFFLWKRILKTKGYHIDTDKPVCS